MIRYSCAFSAQMFVRFAGGSRSTSWSMRAADTPLTSTETAADVFPPLLDAP